MIPPRRSCVADGGTSFICPFNDALTLSRYGSPVGAPGVIVELPGSGTLAIIAAREDRRSALKESALSRFAINLPDLPRRVEGHDIAFIWTGANQWLAHGPPGKESLLAEAFSGLASVVDQSHAWALLRITGPRARDALAKGVAVDLHPRAFSTGFAAATSVAHIAVLLWQLDERPTYEFAVPRSYALSFWHWLQASAAEYGVEFADINNA
jgi:heterotetrameric sarcosine oxidase gamma subunit